MWKGFFEYNINNVDTVGYIRITYKTVGTVEAKSKKYKSTLFMVSTFITNYDTMQYD